VFTGLHFLPQGQQFIAGVVQRKIGHVQGHQLCQAVAHLPVGLAIDIQDPALRIGHKEGVREMV
jgi:hypothetical protein